MFPHKRQNNWTSKHLFYPEQSINLYIWEGLLLNINIMSNAWSTSSIIFIVSLISFTFGIFKITNRFILSRDLSEILIWLNLPHASFLSTVSHRMNQRDFSTNYHMYTAWSMTARYLHTSHTAQTNRSSLEHLIVVHIVFQLLILHALSKGLSSKYHKLQNYMVN